MPANQKLDLNSVGQRARRRIMRRIMRMKGDLGFTDALGLGAGIFFIGYFLLEIPGSILVERWSARGWIARIMITWGIVAILMGFVRTKNQFYLLRFLLGANDPLTTIKE